MSTSIFKILEHIRNCHLRPDLWEENQTQGRDKFQDKEFDWRRDST